jgi:hypothetical protein
VQGLFGQVLRLCHEAGMVRLGVIAIDGTKIAANASWAKSYTAETLPHQVAEEQAAFEALAGQLIGAQVAADAAEDGEHGAGRGDDLPPRLRQRDAAAWAQMLQQQAAKQADYDAQVAPGSRPARAPA